MCLVVWQVINGTAVAGSAVGRLENGKDSVTFPIGELIGTSGGEMCSGKKNLKSVCLQLKYVNQTKSGGTRCVYRKPTVFIGFRQTVEATSVK